MKHIFQCKDKKIIKVRDNSFRIIERTLRRIKYTDQVIRPFVEILKCLCTGKEIEVTDRAGKTVAGEIEDKKD